MATPTTQEEQNDILDSAPSNLENLDADSGVSSTNEEADATRILEENDESDDTSTNDSTTTTTVAKSTSEPLTDEKFLAGLKTLGEQFKQSQAPTRQEQPKLTDDQIRQQLKVWSMPKEWEEVFDNPKQREAIAAMQAATVQQTLAAVGVLLQDQQGRLRQEYQPALTLVQQQSLTNFRNGFFEKYPGFQNIPMEFLDAVYQKNSSKFADKSTDEIYEILATEAEKVAKGLKPDFDPKAQVTKTTTNKTTAKPTKPATLSGGGQSGSGGQPEATTKKLDGGLWD